MYLFDGKCLFSQLKKSLYSEGVKCLTPLCIDPVCQAVCHKSHCTYTSFPYRKEIVTGYT